MANILSTEWERTGVFDLESAQVLLSMNAFMLALYYQQAIANVILSAWSISRHFLTVVLPHFLAVTLPSALWDWLYRALCLDAYILISYWIFFQRVYTDVASRYEQWLVKPLLRRRALAGRTLGEGRSWLGRQGTEVARLQRTADAIRQTLLEFRLQAIADGRMDKKEMEPWQCWNFPVWEYDNYFRYVSFRAPPVVSSWHNLVVRFFGWGDAVVLACQEEIEQIERVGARNAVMLRAAPASLERYRLQCQKLLREYEDLYRHRGYRYRSLLRTFSISAGPTGMAPGSSSPPPRSPGTHEDDNRPDQGPSHQDLTRSTIYTVTYGADALEGRLLTHDVNAARETIGNPAPRVSEVKKRRELTLQVIPFRSLLDVITPHIDELRQRTSRAEPEATSTEGLGADASHCGEVTVPVVPESERPSGQEDEGQIQDVVDPCVPPTEVGMLTESASAQDVDMEVLSLSNLEQAETCAQEEDLLPALEYSSLPPTPSLSPVRPVTPTVTPTDIQVPELTNMDEVEREQMDVDMLDESSAPYEGETSDGQDVLNNNPDVDMTAWPIEARSEPDRDALVLPSAPGSSLVLVRPASPVEDVVGDEESLDVEMAEASAEEAESTDIDDPADKALFPFAAFGTVAPTASASATPAGVVPWVPPPLPATSSFDFVTPAAAILAAPAREFTFEVGASTVGPVSFAPPVQVPGRQGLFSWLPPAAPLPALRVQVPATQVVQEQSGGQEEQEAAPPVTPSPGPAFAAVAPPALVDPVQLEPETPPPPTPVVAPREQQEEVRRHEGYAPPAPELDDDADIEELIRRHCEERGVTDLDAPIDLDGISELGSDSEVETEDPVHQENPGSSEQNFAGQYDAAEAEDDAAPDLGDAHSDAGSISFDFYGRGYGDDGLSFELPSSGHLPADYASSDGSDEFDMDDLYGSDRGELVLEEGDGEDLSADETEADHMQEEGVEQEAGEEDDYDPFADESVEAGGATVFHTDWQLDEQRALQEAEQRTRRPRFSELVGIANPAQAGPSVTTPQPRRIIQPRPIRARASVEEEQAAPRPAFFSQSINPAALEPRPIAQLGGRWAARVTAAQPIPEREPYEDDTDIEEDC